MMNIWSTIKEKGLTGWIVFGGVMMGVFAAGLLIASIMEHRFESHQVLQLVKPIAEWEPRNEVWGENYPREYETYKKTEDGSFRSKYSGSKMVDLLEEDPRLVILWGGYAFSKDYNQGRGHYHAIEDIRKTLRTNQEQPGTCWTCKSTDVPRVMAKIGSEAFYKKSWMELGPEIVNNIGCQDCHDPQTMNLRITRPALSEAFKRQGKDISDASHQEMRSLVCAQCHVEYYFKGKGKYLTFPWDKGLTIEDMEKYYDEEDHVDWVHSLSRAPMLKAQHPDFEIYKMGTHAERGISCADCHMPYKSEGGVKFTNHWMRSPLADVANSCGVCHRWSEEEFKEKVYGIQDKIMELKKIAENSLIEAHLAAKYAWEIGAKEDEMKGALKMIRHAQWRWDFVSSSNAVGFHAPLESSRILGASIERSKGALVALAQVLAKHGVFEFQKMPDISTKAKAQKLIGIDIEKEEGTKQEFLKNVVPRWDEHE